MRRRFSALPSGQQATICIKGGRALDQTRSSDLRGRCCGERPHHCILGEQPGGSLQGRVVSLPVVSLPLYFLTVEKRRGVTVQCCFFSIQVHLTAEPYAYSKTPGNIIGEKVNRNLFFDLSHSHLYITTEKRVNIACHGPFCNYNT